MESNVKQTNQRERLEILVINLKITLRDLAQIVGVNENTLYHTNSGSKGRMSERTASKICYFLEKEKGVLVNRDWLLYGEGDMFDEKYTPICVEEVSAADEQEEGVDWKARYLDLLEKYTALLEDKQ